MIIILGFDFDEGIREIWQKLDEHNIENGIMTRDEILKARYEVPIWNDDIERIEMTPDEAILILKSDNPNNIAIRTSAFEDLYDKRNKAFSMAIESLQFAKWVAEEIFSDYWEYNKEGFEEIACRKLAKLGIVRAEGDEWILVETQESED